MKNIQTVLSEAREMKIVDGKKIDATTNLFLNLPAVFSSLTLSQKPFENARREKRQKEKKKEA